ncbi:2-amino-4-hydroxy-6-hydroxymethyldihydropteridine diphosphokinase [Aliamphritea spongicola]|uniref:2-amino-4-hydroxy-6- hydroxymethyldihydropteridine diphosphokinase n=1 Tax=Aliamphritea spongicola TaxID=707589 RepID=UPI00196ACD31|nr:2-amino-4-hydroxy-6-hydroxymethyldihydropteridine diphosphokinase [Aliamphritea spongicola]MBN3563752.1 2-amino-4-hydroxy-6-hydroxymethyldihydropteridine diphosphokinase [Aliamphritea spongicola]
MAKVFVSIGSNQEREHNICGALDALQATFSELRLSPVYESDAVGFDGAPFYNLVAEFTTDLELAALNATLKDIEDQHGRCRKSDSLGRTLDIDILTYDNLIGDFDGVQLPRAEVLVNSFVLRPLAELSPKSRHPESGETYQDLWRDADKDKQPLTAVDFIWQEKQISAV